MRGAEENVAERRRAEESGGERKRTDEMIKKFSY
jgi:hypothetical protein